MATESGGLSKEEFLLVQEQLLQLRNENYVLKEEIKKKNVQQQQQNSPKNEALQFASKLINRASSSKKDEKDAEIDGLRRKLETQEEEFRLQQSTLFEELKTISAHNEDLKSQIASYSDHPLEKEAAVSLEDKIKNLEQEKTILCSETIPTLNEKVSSLREQLETCETLNVELEDRVLALTAYAEKSDEEKEALKRRSAQEIEAVRQENLKVVEEVQNKIKAIEDENEKLAGQISELKAKNEDLERIVLENSEVSKLLNNLQTELADTKTDYEKKVANLAHQLETSNSEKEILLAEMQKDSEDSKKSQEKAVEDRILLLETRFQLEVDDVKKSFESEKEKLQLKIASLGEKLKAADEEKKTAVKKQMALVKELQKTLKEERKRADSYERKSEERAGWHVVSQENDRQSSHTFDGNESVSSLSAIESENVELITRLATLQKIHSENADTILQLESENSRLRREVSEKGELIENLIREKPLGFGNPNSPTLTSHPKLEASFRKLLNTLGQDSSTSDVREMNKKLQRMLEETLSKNIILQRDLQTIMERTGL